MQKLEKLATAEELKAAEQLIGTVIAGRYQVEALLGVGAMASVYLVRHVDTRTHMAVKVLHQSMLRVPEMVARFEREAMVGAHIDHPNVAKAHAFGRTADGGFFLALEFIEGHELRAVLKQGPLAVSRTITIARQITSALCLAHGLQIIHRDLKPENIMLTQCDGKPDFVKILDFGLAKVPEDLGMQESSPMTPGAVPQQLTKVGALYGSPGYMAPEQVLGETVDCRSDLYSLGATLYEMLTGRPPFDGNTILDLIDEHLKAPLPLMRQRAPSVSVPEPVEDIVRRLLAKQPEDRFRDPAELLAALNQLPAAEPITLPAAEPIALSAAEPIGLPAPVATPPPSEAQPAAKSQFETPAQQPAPPNPPVAVRRGTIVARQLDPGSFWSRLLKRNKALPGQRS